MKLQIQTTGHTDTGKARTENQDEFYDGKLWGDDRYWLAMGIDGCGGHHGGKHCAELVRKYMLEYLGSNRKDDKKALLKEALVFANNEVYKKRVGEYRSMCCVATAILVEVEEKTFHMVHVGDSRLYAYADSRIIKLSHDHSPIGREEDNGVLDEVQAMTHGCRHIIERAIGQKMLNEDTDYIETNTFAMTAGMTWLLCSDGLTDMVTSAQIVDVLDQQMTLAEKATTLVKKANEAGGKDNITVVLVQADAEYSDENLRKNIMDDYAKKFSGNSRPDYDEVLSKTTIAFDFAGMSGKNPDIPAPQKKENDRTNEDREDKAGRIVSKGVKVKEDTSGENNNKRLNSWWICLYFILILGTVTIPSIILNKQAHPDEVQPMPVQDTCITPVQMDTVSTLLLPADSTATMR